MSTIADRSGPIETDGVQSRNPRPLALTMGDPAGIGLDIAIKAWCRRDELDTPPFVLIGCFRALTARASMLGVDLPTKVVSSVAEARSDFTAAMPVYAVPAPDVVAGRPDIGAAEAVIKSIETGVHLVRSGEASALVTNPIAKSVLKSAGFKYPGHTEFLANLDQRIDGVVPTPVMMLASDELRVVPTTIHIPLNQVRSVLTTELLTETIGIVVHDLKRRFLIERPRIVVSGLNPHAGESGTMGDEESNVITPAIQKLQQSGLDVRGPYPADSLFHERVRQTYDATVCMYHDQALIPIKTIAFDRAVNITLGLSFVRTSPDHGTAFDIAGTGKAEEISLVEALKLASRMAQAELANAR